MGTPIETELTSQYRARDTELQSLIDGLSLPQKTISPKYFYDEYGSELFERITELPEYYPTRTELGILTEHVEEMGASFGDDASLIEFGAGASAKVRILLDALQNIIVFVPVDISGDHLKAAADELAADYPNVQILPVAADFTRPFELPTPKRMPARNVVFFPGSTIGNFAPDAALDLLRTMRTVAKDSGGLLIGVDLQKDPAILERAYDDAEGVTATFNRNMLTHLNREFGSDFDANAFRHVSRYNTELNRIEMHLVSERDQTFTLGDTTFSIAKDETILTECSYKYTVDGFVALAAKAGFLVHKTWLDDNELFSVHYATAVAPGE
ncbi:MAG: L-histidine N(alpha)-methyltransferase [Pseudomonadota bacterium]